MSERTRMIYSNFAPQLEAMSEVERLATYAVLDEQAIFLRQRLTYIRHTAVMHGELKDVNLKAAMIEGQWLWEIMNRTVELKSPHIDVADQDSDRQILTTASI